MTAQALSRVESQAKIAKLRLEAFRDREALKRLRVISRAYDAAKPNQYHPKRGDKRSPDAVMSHAGTRLREIARYLDENSDIAIAVLDDLTNKGIGCGIGIEPTIKTTSGKLHQVANAQAREMWAAWTHEAVDVRRDLTWGELQRLLFRSYLRDGEVLAKHVEGVNLAITHRGPIPYSIEILEADYLPFDLFANAGANRIVHGVELNGWGQAVAYHLARYHPGDLHQGRQAVTGDPIRHVAERITHLKFTRRAGQTRGVTVFHGVLNRMQDVKDYDESELIAARVASAFTVAITRSDAYTGQVQVADGKRQYELAPGLIIDDLLPGESVETISSNRPNAAYENFRNAQVRGIAGGTGTSYSSVAKRYDGTYSAQRQELVESVPAYRQLRMAFIDRFLRDVYRRAIDLAVISGQISIRGVNPASLYSFEAIEPALPWIDPLKEGKADELALKNNLASRHQIIRARGGDPAEVDAQIEADPLAVEPTPEPAPMLPDLDVDDLDPTELEAEAA